MVASLTTSDAEMSALDRPASDQRDHLPLAVGQRSQELGCVGLRMGAGSDEGFDQPAGGGRRQQSLPGCDHPDRVEHPLGRCILEQEAAGTGDQRCVDVLIRVEGGQDEDADLLGSRVLPLMIRVASMPSITGIRMSISTTCGRSLPTTSTAAARSSPPRPR